MSTVTRRKKVAEARKAAKAVVSEPLFADDDVPKQRNGNGAKTKVEATRKLRQAKPIYANLGLVSDYAFTDHAAEQMAARNISPAEVFSAIANPDTIALGNKQDEEGTKQLERGDIRVVVNSDDRAIITVIDLEADVRKEPRVPQVAKLIESQKIPAVLPDLEVRPTGRVPKGVPENDDTKWLFAKHTRKDVRFVDISPVIAAALLDRNTRNRKKRPSDVDDWASEMAAGRWRETNQGIGIARDGVIADGQHRLQAIVDSGVTVNMVVVVGLDPEVFSVIDTGRRRTSGDALGMVGEAQTTQLAAIVRGAYEFDLLAGGSRVVRKVRLHHDVLLGYRSGKEEELREATRAAQSSRQFGLPVNKTAFGVAWFVIHRDGGDAEMAEQFFDQLRTGADLSRTDPIYVLRRVISTVAAQRRVNIRDMHLALILKAWSLYVRGEEPRNLSWRGDEEMPVVYRAKRR